jgi:hypothetical protein
VEPLVARRIEPCQRRRGHGRRRVLH